MILVTGCNESYQHRMNSYIDSLTRHADFPVYFVGVDFEPNRNDKPIIPVMITNKQNAGAPERIECIQHGSFMQVIPGKASDLIMCTDGDFIMQRPIDDDEKKLLKLKKGQVAVGYNGGAGETLLTEAYRLSQKISYDDMARLWGDNWQELSIYNTGCIVATRTTWGMLYDEYMKKWDDVCVSFEHTARQQWLISWVIQTYLKPVILPWSLHAHGHFGMKPGMEWGDGGIWADGKLALFRHYL